MPRARKSPRPSEAEKLRRRAARRYAALEAMMDAPDGLAPSAVLGRDIGLLVGLEKDSFAARRPNRDRVGDLRFVFTDSGRAALAAADGRLP